MYRSVVPVTLRAISSETTAATIDLLLFSNSIRRLLLDTNKFLIVLQELKEVCSEQQK